MSVPASPGRVSYDACGERKWILNIRFRTVLWMSSTVFVDTLGCIWMSVVLFWDSGFVDSFTSHVRASCLCEC